ncbi:MAG: hypothetical protein WCL08_04295 [Verrucomicrobiota bacterium]
MRKKSPDKKGAACEVVVVISDTHCGSNQGLAHPESELSSGNTVGFGKNHHQRWLWENWMEAKNQVKALLRGRSGILVINGDATEGAHHHTQELIASSIAEHTDIAVKCFEEFRDGLKLQDILVVRGTECHTREMEDVLAERLGARNNKARDKWLFRVNGCLVDCAHHIGTSARKYLEASALSIYMGNNRLNALDAGHMAPQVMCRAHRHCGGMYTNGAATMVVTGGWQFLTRHGHKVVTDSIPSPTVAVLDWAGKPKGALPTVHEIKFFPPQDTITNF